MAERPYALSIAGVDPSAGAGLLADIKTFEQLKVYGLGVPTANTIQTEDSFYSNEWISAEYIMESTKRMISSYPVKVVKIGVIKELNLLINLLKWVKLNHPVISVIWDPVIRSSTSFEFNQDWKINEDIFQYVDLITPNLNEWEYLKTHKISDITCSVLLTGGHDETKKGVDQLYFNDQWIEIPPQTSLETYEKHGSGCVLSSAVTAYMAKGSDILTACKKAKEYTEKFLSSTSKKLGYHNGEIALHITR